MSIITALLRRFKATKVVIRCVGVGANELVIVHVTHTVSVADR